jgi:hypothetical protein
VQEWRTGIRSAASRAKLAIGNGAFSFPSRDFIGRRDSQRERGTMPIREPSKSERDFSGVANSWFLVFFSQGARAVGKEENERIDVECCVKVFFKNRKQSS